MLMQSRRQFLTTLSLASAAGLVRAPLSLAAEGTIETATVRIPWGPAICIAPQYVGEELLRAEGFTDIRFVKGSTSDMFENMRRGEVDFGMTEPIMLVRAIVDGAPMVVLAGVHGGCYELFAQQGIHHVSELKGKPVATDNPWLFDLI